LYATTNFLNIGNNPVENSIRPWQLVERTISLPVAMLPLSDQLLLPFISNL
jgi:hypothetical protein